MNPKGIDFVAYNVTDMDRAEAFYRDALGLEVTTERGEPGTRANGFMEVSAGGSTVALTALDPLPNGVVAIAVEDVGAAVEELRGKGVPVLMEALETPDCYMAAVADPDGNQIMLHRRKDGTAG